MTSSPPRSTIAPRLSRSCCTVLATLAALALAQTAWAEDFVVAANTTQLRHGDHWYSNVTIAGRLSITPYDGADETTGWLRIHAHTITITDSGVIGCAHDNPNCTPAGYPGSSAGGSGYPPSNAGMGSTPSNSSVAGPGGGGAHLGDGGDGVTVGDPDCISVAEASGGSHFTSVESDPLTLLGASGGAAHAGPVSPGTSLAGGNGGGAVILEAAVIVLNGRIIVDGQDAVSGLAAPGGGAGGAIIIRTNDFTFNPATALLSARGGDGRSYGGLVGGSGGGGLIRLELAADTSALTLECSGGDVQQGCSATAGSSGTCETADAPPTCLDADGDQAPNELCGGSDCDDGDPSINAGADEICNGLDDNCSGEADEQVEDAPLICPQGATFVCAEGECVPVDAGPTAEIAYSGGLCTTRPAAGGVGAMSALLLCLAAAVTGGLIIRVRWRRRPSR